MPDSNPVNGLVAGALALGLVLTGCGTSERASPQTVPASALEGLLLSASEVDTVMSTTGMTPHATVTVMGDHRNLLPNLNCLGVWQVNEAAIYGAEGWGAVRQQLLRSPDSDDWTDLVVQSVVNYPSPEAARDFFNQSAERWSKCTDHNVNITLNDRPLPKWRSGALTKTDTRLAMPFTRGTGDQTRSCQRVLAVAANVIMDVQACKPPTATVTQAAAIADDIESALPR